MADTQLDNIEERIAETRQSWIESSHRLLSMIEVPVVRNLLEESDGK